MYYALVIDSKVEKYPYTISQLKLDNPQTSFPNNVEADAELLETFNVHRVFTTIIPDYNAYTHKHIEKTPTLKDGKYIQVWEVVELSDVEKNNLEEHEKASVRSKRNHFLMLSDWTQGKDIPDEVSQLWQSYRQELRDITEQDGFPFNVEWPTKPE